MISQYPHWKVSVMPIRFVSRRYSLQFGILLSGLVFQSHPCSAESIGQWTSVIQLPSIPVAAAVLPDGRVLGWSSNDLTAFSGDVGHNPTQTYTEFRTLSGSTASVVMTDTDMFCPGTAYLPDGRILVSGGDSSPRTSIFDPSSNNWSSDADMSVARGYHSNVMLSTGSVFTIGGSWSGGVYDDKIGEVWAPGQGWSARYGISAQSITGPDPEDVDFIYRGDNHAWLFAAKDGRVFHAGPSAEMHWITTDGDGTVASAGNRGDDPYSMGGKAVLYDVGKIFKTGGAPAYQDAQATANTYTIDINAAAADPQQPVVVNKTASMQYPRAFANAVVLPTGQIFVVGGQTYAVPFSDDTAILTPELWDPATETFAPLAPMKTPRVYHSVALLQPDGRVFVGGGGLCGDCATNHADAEIFSPPYLFNPDGSEASRPAITSAPSTGNLGQLIYVTTDVDVTSFALMRLSTVTHTVDNDQRRVPLAIWSRQSSGNYTLSLPSDVGTAPPGYYMLFALNGQGVPSQAQMIRLQ